jgi:hypothetical protein
MANPKGLNTLGSWANLVRQSRDQDSKTEDGNGFFYERWVSAYAEASSFAEAMEDRQPIYEIYGEDVPAMLRAMF